MQFFLKWITFAGFISGPSSESGLESLSRAMCWGMCGCCRSLKMCLFVSCGGCCRTSKRRERMKRWLRAEMTESATWDWGTTGKEKYAELVIGTDHSMHFEQGKKDGERTYTVSPGMGPSNERGQVDLKLRE